MTAKMTMKTELVFQRLIGLLVAIGFIAMSVQASAQETGKRPAWMPNPPKAVSGSQCDEDPKWMRIWHMKVLDHKRDETMHQGIRTKKYSLKRCITCHAVKDDDDKFLTVKDERHFCRSCHDYAAVTMDCFGCHTSRPVSKKDENAKAMSNPHKKQVKMSSPDMKMAKALDVLNKFVGRKSK